MLLDATAYRPYVSLPTAQAKACELYDPKNQICFTSASLITDIISSLNFFSSISNDSKWTK